MAVPVIQPPSALGDSLYSDVNQNTISPSQFGNDWQKNPNYMLTLYNHAETDPNLATVQCYLPEQFHFRIENQWEPFLLSLGNVGETIDKVNNVANIAGVSFNFKFLSALIWKRTEPIGFSFTLNFDAKTSSLVDVKQPVANLINMASPRRAGIGNSVLTAPGPTLANPNANISMKIGRFFYCDSVVIDSMDVTNYTAFEGNGDPIAADVEISMRCWYTPDRDDILSYFGMGDTTIANYIKSVPQDYSQAPPIYRPPSISEALKSFASGGQGTGNPSDTPLAGAGTN